MHVDVVKLAEDVFLAGRAVEVEYKVLSLISNGTPKDKLKTLLAPREKEMKSIWPPTNQNLEAKVHDKIKYIFASAKKLRPIT